ncbi:hypothetical protein [Paenibacillus sp. 1P07SE]|uniref:hypothetical protein n=1 Tax=Paenibacillus sp. 1P07SE TaxID=3132209 RepID=UPI0039A457F2
MFNKKGILLTLSMLLIASVIAGFSYADTSKLNFFTDSTNDEAKVRENYYKVYSETPLIMDSTREIKMYEVTDGALLAEIEEMYNDPSHVFEESLPGNGVDYYDYAINNNPLPYYFNFNFRAELTSQRMINPNRGTVRISALGEWEEEHGYNGSDYSYYDITLYSVGNGAITTARFRHGMWRHYDFTNVPAGEMYFVMTKHPQTCTESIIGSGVVVKA